VASRAEAPTLVIAAALCAPWQARFDALRAAHFPPGRNRVPAHVSLLHRLPGDLLDAAAREIAAALAAHPAAARLTGIRLLGRGVAITLDAPGLAALHARLAAAFAPHLTAQDRQPYAPHVTVQNKADPADARALADTLAAAFVPAETAIAHVTIWHYRPDGTWQEARRLAWPGA
jgi:2'-5' RNA ligase